MTPSRWQASHAWRGAAAGALLLGPASVAIASHYSAGLSGGAATQFTVDVGVASTTGHLWPLSWMAGIVGGAVAGALAVLVASALGGERGARLGLLVFGLVAGAGLGLGVGSLAQEVAVTVTAGPDSSVSSHHASAATGRHPPAAVTGAWTATGTGHLAMKASVSRRRHWGMLAFSIPFGVLTGLVTARGLAPAPRDQTGRPSHEGPRPLTETALPSETP